MRTTLHGCSTIAYYLPNSEDGHFYFMSLFLRLQSTEFLGSKYKIKRRKETACFQVGLNMVLNKTLQTVRMCLVQT